MKKLRPKLFAVLALSALLTVPVVWPSGASADEGAGDRAPIEQEQPQPATY
jgi:hypothetical protein